MFLLSGMSVKDSYLSLGKLDLSMYDLDTVIVYKRFLEGELCNLSVDKIKSSVKNAFGTGGIKTIRSCWGASARNTVCLTYPQAAGRLPERGCWKC